MIKCTVFTREGDLEADKFHAKINPVDGCVTIWIESSPEKLEIRIGEDLVVDFDDRCESMIEVPVQVERCFHCGGVATTLIDAGEFHPDGVYCSQKCLTDEIAAEEQRANIRKSESR